MADETRLLAGRYRLGELIGRGGMSNVYSGRDERLGRQVAIKLLKSQLAGDPVFRTRFRQEAQAASRMAHPTIVRVFDAGEERVAEAGGFEGVVPFIVMEFVEGRLLKDIIKEGPLDSAEAIRITDGILTALEYSHRAGVVHRDIKPGNVMVTHGGQVKVMDFGIARAISDSSATVAQTTAILGTAQYFSPEQARGESVDARTDLYSTGVVLFEMLTGEPPFKGETPVAVAYQHVSEMPVAPSSINPLVSPAIDQVVLHALAKDRFARFQSAVEFRTDLETAGAGRIPSKRLPVEDFQTSLFGAPPSLAQGGDSALTQLAGDDEYTVRTQSRPPVVWIWAGIASVAVILIGIVVWVLSLQPSTELPSTSREVPSVTGQTFEAADATLQQLDLVTARYDVVSDTVPAGQVIDTDPGAGTIVSPGTVIDVHVSSGRETVAIPSVAGSSVTDGAAALVAAGFTVGQTIKENSPDIAADVIIRTDPAVDAAAYAGDTIDMVVSTGMVSVPSVIGLPISDGTTRMTDLLLVVTPRAVTNCTEPANTVVRQSIAEGDATQRSEIVLEYCS
ncbi:Stk1 family PASTA domain-containing Ser/Thr kinase [Herbiconiux moechotypicola]|uniref:non-specific serine/threonine protein kinase n=1 Tax=Herbiconiux moechotypicola TaxID=637393 RepID=A0ABN3DB56_9MICO|nr:Stk1 family PASTA domain-containing Ser/Thr kinase [Herbiconiux moechotypicola]MCS5728881.1 Stk1 family PASTA domain-containing Ser/Thr kinase [Herbiconiux moechotypicola]